MAEISETEEPIVAENTCRVCKEEYSSEKYPKLLPCLHTVCGPCVSGLTGKEGEKAKCPECESLFDRGDVIKHLHLMERLTACPKGEEREDEEKSHTCTACEEEQQAGSFCTQCMEWLCEQCVQAHRRVRVTKDHLIQAKEKVQEQANGSNSVQMKERLMTCSLHQNEPLKLYCETCDKLTCRDCQLLEHKEHKYQFVHEASDLCKQQLLHLTEKLAEKRNCIVNAKELINKRQEEIVSREKAVAEEVKKTIESVIEEFNKRAKAILTDLNLVCSAKKAQLTQKNTEVTDLATRLDHCKGFVESLVETGSNLSILHTKSMIIKHMRGVLQSRCEVPNPNHVVDIRYSQDINLFLKNLNHLGFLFVDGVPFRPSGKPGQPGMPSDMNGSPAAQGQAGVRNYLQELQKLSSEQRNAVFMRMMQMQRRQAVQQNTGHSGPPGPPAGVAAVHGQPPPNRVVSNNYQVNTTQYRPHNNNSHLNRYSSPGQPMNNGPTHQSPPSYTAPPGGPGYGSVGANQQSNQMISLFQLQNQRGSGHSPHPAQNPQGRPMPPLMLRPTNNGVPSSGPIQSGAPYGGQGPPQNHSTRAQLQKERNWRWSYVHMPNMSSPPRPPSGVGGHGTEQRPGSTPEMCRTSPSANATRPASADSVKIKQEKDAGSAEYGGFSSCSYSEKQNSVRPENSSHNNRKGEPQPAAPCPGDGHSSSSAPDHVPAGLLPEAMSEDNLDAALRSLSEDGLSFGMDTALGISRPPNPTRHLPAPSKHMDSPDPSEDYCACCHNGGELLCCDYCPKVFHFQCHIPAVTVAPSGSWRCTLSLPDEDIRIQRDESREIVYAGHKRKSPVGLTDKELKACERILLELFSHEASTPFHEPVSKSVPNYYKIITNPMDFTNIKCKLARQHFNHYSTVGEFLSDVKLVFTNCAMYNSELSEVGRAGKSVFLYFEKLVEKFLPYYLPLLKEEQPAEASPPSHPSTTPPLPAQPSPQTVQSDGDQAKGAKRRKMDKQNVIHNVHYH